MRDRNGIERGHCKACAAAEIECCEFTYRSATGPELDYAEAFEPAPPEEYARDPVLSCLRPRIYRRESGEGVGDESTWRITDTEVAPAFHCLTCGCSAEMHEVTTLSETEEWAIAMVRRLFRRVDLQDCIAQSVHDTLSLNLPREHFTYGEIGPLSFFRLLDRVAELRHSHCCAPPPGGGIGTGAEGAFYDLGCGVGKAVALASLHPVGFSRCVGVELLPGLCAIAKRLTAPWATMLRMEASKADANGIGRRPLPEAAFVRGDLFDTELGDAALVLLNIGSWQEPNLTRLRRFLIHALPDRCMLITVRKPITEAGIAEELAPIEEHSLPMSWGLAPAFLVERRCQRPAPQAPTQAPVRLLDLGTMD